MLAFRRFDTPSMKACYSAEWLIYLEESGNGKVEREKRIVGKDVNGLLSNVSFSCTKCNKFRTIVPSL